MDINYSLSRYTEDIFRYCAKRLNNIEDAKDLTQEIFLEALKGMQKGNISNIDAWIWKIAHNRYARFVSKAKTVTVSLDDSGIIDTLAEENEFFAEDNSDETRAVFAAVHSIANSHRDILIDFYISGLSYSQIAKKHSLPFNTVKTRLFYGRQKLKERWQSKMEQENASVYEKIRWFVFGNGDVDPYRYCTRQIARAIASVCYEKALNIEEISLRTGIPCIYIEDEIPQLLHGEILSRQGDKYLTDIIIHSAALIRAIEEILLKSSAELAKDTACILQNYDGQIRETGFYGNHWHNRKIWWFLIPVLLRQSCEEARRQHGKSAKPVPFPPRKDGGNGWIFVNESTDEKHRYLSGCNGYWRKNSILTYYWSGKYFSDEINNYLCHLEDTPALFQKGTGALSELQIAEGIKYNIIAKDGESFNWNIAVFTEAQMEALNALKKEMAAPIAAKLLPLVHKIYDWMLAEVPKRLHHQIRGVFGAELNSVIAMICDCLEDDGKLEKPKDEYFADQILMTVK